ncbi:MAG: methyltransferase domain-containing protein [Litorimonas sp.]
MLTNSNTFPQSTFSNTKAIPIVSQWFGSWNIQLGRRAHTADELSNRYDAIATIWDKTLSKFETPEAYRILLSKALPDSVLLDDVASPRILDCGVGTGAFLAACADMVNGNAELHGLDVSKAMLKKAREALKTRGWKGSFSKGDIRQLPYPNNCFDIVLAAHVIEHISDPQIALAEMVRVLKPGGTLLICVTRKSVIGRAIQFRWRTHAIDEVRAIAWLDQVGLKAVRPIRALSTGDFDKMSIACAAQKPFFEDTKHD